MGGVACRLSSLHVRRNKDTLRHDGWKVNHKRIERLWRREGLKVPKKQPKRGRLWLNDGWCIRLRPQYKDHVWAYDFVHARTNDGRPLRMLTLVDEYTRECLSIDVARRLNSEEVLERLTWLFVTRGVPKYLRSDNGAEFTCTAVRSWLAKVGVATLFIEPGSPWENGYVESFNGKLRDELLDREIFYTLLEAKVLIERWRMHYNRIRPHSSLGYRPLAPEAVAFSALAAGCATWPRDSTPPAADLAAGACCTNIGSGTMDGGRSVERRDTARNMTTPARARWVLRRAPGKRPPRHSDQREWVKFGVHRQAFSSQPQFGFETKQRFAKMAASEAANGKSRNLSLVLVGSQNGSPPGIFCTATQQWESFLPSGKKCRNRK